MARGSWNGFGALRLAGLAGLLLLGFGGGQALAQGAQPTVPQYAKDVHLGVASCAGSTCHGAVAPWRNSNVLQNEYTTWESKDPHSGAYKVLLSEESKRIARNLGLPNAHEAKVCLDCHANNVPEELRGRQFQMSDGVSCEACHGGGERWLGIHVSGRATHADNVAAGLYPTPNPVARAELCLSCHFGDETKFVTHRMMGAGHPRMPFELDTFTWIQPAHYKIDDDYTRRKAVANGVKTWAIGQAIAVRRLMRSVADPQRNVDGVFPEFVLYDCQACHTPLSNVAWERQELQGIGPGVIRLHGANALMLEIIAERTSPALAGELRERSRAVHVASVRDRGQMQQAALALAGTADQLVDAFAARDFGADDVRALLRGVIDAGTANGGFPDYAAAEQATMALGAIVDALRNMGLVDDSQHKAMQAALEGAYAAVEKDFTFDPKVYAAALQQFQASIPSL